LANFIDLLKRIGFGRKEPDYTSNAPVHQAQSLTQDDIDALKRLGLTVGELSKKVSEQISISYDRQSRYQEYVNAASMHWYMAGASSEIADLATTKDDVQNRTIWIHSKDQKVYNEGMKFLDSISIEDRLYDWAWNCAVYGDLFVRQTIKPGVGIVDIDDRKYPGWIYRVDHEGRLIGFVETHGQNVQVSEYDLLPPWVYTHFKLQGARASRYNTSNMNYPNFGAAGVLTPETMYDVSTNYGASIFMNGMAAYKRLVLVEDSLLLARLSRGLLRYIYKVGVNGTNNAAIAEIIDAYTVVLKRARAQNTGNNPFFDSSLKTPGVTEDIILPVYGDVGNVVIEKIGGEADIKWIVDIEDARSQLASAVRVPLQMLGGFQGTGSAGIGSSEIEVYDARFARVVKNVQRCIQNGVTRMLQIHFAAIGLPPDALDFTLNMATTSATEEAARRDIIDKGCDTATKVISLYKEVYGEDGLPAEEKKKLLDYMNKKIIKLNDVPEVEPRDDNSFGAFVNKFSENADLKAPTGNWHLKRLDESSEETSPVFTDLNWERVYQGKKVKIESKAKSST